MTKTVSKEIADKYTTTKEMYMQLPFATVIREDKEEFVVKEEKKVVSEEVKDEDLELAQKMYEEKIGKLPPNKKNDKDRLLSKLAD